MLEEILPTYADEDLGTSWLFQQYKCSSHVSENTHSWFEIRIVTTLQWPSRSTNLNLTENLRYIRDSNVYANRTQFNYLQDLISTVQEKWKKLSLMMFSSLFCSMK